MSDIKKDDPGVGNRVSSRVIIELPTYLLPHRNEEKGMGHWNTRVRSVERDSERETVVSTPLSELFKYGSPLFRRQTFSDPEVLVGTD